MPRVGPLEDHFVKMGDTMDKIAASNGLAVSVLRELNGLTNDLLRVGQNVKVAPSRWGTVKSISEIVEWYRKAAEQGNARARDNLRRLGQYNVSSTCLPRRGELQSN